MPIVKRSVFPKNVKDALARLRALDRTRRISSNDPMMDACGCYGDFAEDWDRRERTLLAYVLRNSPAGSRRHRYAMDRMESFLP